MAPVERFVKITNACEHVIKIYFTSLRPKKGRRPPLLTPFELTGGTTSRPVPYMRLVGARNWEELMGEGCIRLEDVIWTPAFGTIENKSPEPLQLDLPLPSKPKQRKPASKQIIVPADRKSRALFLPSLVQRRRLNELAKRKTVVIEPVPHVGPRIGEPPAVGSYGYDDVYVCWDCGGPIIFRYNPPVPIHVG